MNGMHLEIEFREITINLNLINIKNSKNIKIQRTFKSQNHKQIKDVANIIIYSVADDDYLYTSVRRKVYVWNGEKLGEVCFGEVIFK